MHPIIIIKQARAMQSLDTINYNPKALIFLDMKSKKLN